MVIKVSNCGQGASRANQMPPMGETSPTTCRWAQLASSEAVITNLVDLPPEQQVARGKELLSMLHAFPLSGGSNMSMSPPQQQLSPAAASINPGAVPPPPMEMPPPPPMGYEVSQKGTSSYSESTSGDWANAQVQLSSSTRPGAAAVPAAASLLAPHMAPGVWGLASGPASASAGAGAGTAGHWAPLSTNPGNTTSWSSNAVPPEAGGSLHLDVAVVSTPSTMPYSMSGQAPDASMTFGGHWSENGALVYSAMPSMMSASRAEPNSLRSQMRAEAAPYVPGTFAVGVQAC